MYILPFSFFFSVFFSITFARLLPKHIVRVCVCMSHKPRAERNDGTKQTQPQEELYTSLVSPSAIRNWAILSNISLASSDTIGLQIICSSPLKGSRW
uniref:Putative secreted protein n=1 Tax=Anopheles darlingi TaxID=43151 RepID=A0A2M4DKW0_ANODA